MLEDRGTGDLSLIRRGNQIVLVIYLDDNDPNLRLEINFTLSEAETLLSKLQLEVAELKREREN